MVRCILGLLLVVLSSLAFAEENNSTSAEKEEDPNRPQLKEVSCSKPQDCNSIDGTYCDVDLGLCLCKPDYPVTDSNHCYKESRYDEFCQLDIQCQRRDKNTKCNRDFNMCECQPRYIAQSFGNGQQWCVKPTTSVDTTIGSYVDPALFGIMGALALMFIIICVVLQLFAKARFQENRSIFNTPNPRLMNVSLLKDGKIPSSQPTMSKKRKSRTASASQDSDGEEPTTVSNSGTAGGGGGGNANRKRSSQAALKGLRRASSSVVSSGAGVAAASSIAEDKILVEAKDSMA